MYINSCQDLAKIDLDSSGKYEVVFLKNEMTKDGIKFQTKRRDQDTNEIYTEDIEVDKSYRGSAEGSFFPYVNLSPVDLSDFQIYYDVDKKNSRDNCFVYAFIQSGVLTEEEINQMRFFAQTKSIPNYKILDVAKKYKCQFVVRRINEAKSMKN